jgi:hypothetical protein
MTLGTDSTFLRAIGAGVSRFLAIWLMDNLHTAHGHARAYDSWTSAGSYDGQIFVGLYKHRQFADSHHGMRPELPSPCGPIPEAAKLA